MMNNDDQKLAPEKEYTGSHCSCGGKMCYGSEKVWYRKYPVIYEYCEDCGYSEREKGDHDYD